MARKYILFSGQVQGVGFRYHSTVLARQLGLTGWVRNLDDGDVEMEIQGKPETIELFLASLGKTSRYIQIDAMKIIEQEEIIEHSFYERY